MKLRLPMAVAISMGALTLVAYFIPVGPLAGLRLLLLTWASTLAAVALLVGIANLALVHLRRLSTFRGPWVYSLALLVAFVLVLGFGLLSLMPTGPQEFADIAAFSRDAFHFAFVFIQIPVEASLAALLVVIMVVAGARLLRARRNWSAVAFIVVSLILLLGFATINLPLLNALPGLRSWIMQVPAAGAARGLLLGIALGTITTGLRVIIGADRPYGE